MFVILAVGSPVYSALALWVVSYLARHHIITGTWSHSTSAFEPLNYQPNTMLPLLQRHAISNVKWFVRTPVAISYERGNLQVYLQEAAAPCTRERERQRQAECCRSIRLSVDCNVLECMSDVLH